MSCCKYLGVSVNTRYTVAKICLSIVFPFFRDVLRENVLEQSHIEEKAKQEIENLLKEEEFY